MSEMMFKDMWHKKREEGNKMKKIEILKKDKA
jgi:hypothetical protein